MALFTSFIVLSLLVACPALRPRRQSSQDSWLACQFGHDNDVSQLNGTAWGMGHPWGRIPRSVIAQVSDQDSGFDVGAEPIISAGTAQSTFLQMLQILNDFSSRSGNRYWLVHDQLAGLVRAGRLSPWENHVDFCFEDSAKSYRERIQAAYGVQTDIFVSMEQDPFLTSWLGQRLGGWLCVLLGRSKVWRGLPLAKVNPSWSDFMLVYSEDQSFLPDLYVFSISKGLKAQTLDEFNCFSAPEFALPPRIVSMEGIDIPIPRDPVKWLSLVDYPGDKDFQPDMNTVLMPTDRWDRCLFCPRGANLSPTNGTASADTDSVFDIFDFEESGSLQEVTYSHRGAIETGQCTPIGSIGWIPVRSIFAPHVAAPHPQQLRHGWPEVTLLAVSLVAVMVAVSMLLRHGNNSNFLQVSCLLSYITMSAADYLLIRFVTKRHGGHLPFSNMCAVVVLEVSKFIVTMILIVGGGKMAQLQRVTQFDACLLFVPAFGYFCHNVLFFYSLSHAPLAVFGLCYELQIVFISGLWMVAFRRMLSPLRLLACVGVALGVWVQWKSETYAGGAPPRWHVYAFPILSAFTVAAAAVANEYIYKLKADMDLDVQNFFIYGWGTLAGLVAVALCQPDHLGFKFFEGVNYADSIALITLRMAIGLTVSRILKYVDCVSQTMAKTIACPLAIALAQTVVEEPVTPGTVFAASVTYLASYLFWTSAAEAKSSK